MIDSLYRNHGTYVNAVKDSARSLEREGFLTTYDARELQRDAAQSRIP